MVEVGVIMGSQSDWDTMRHAAETLGEIGIPLLFCGDKFIALLLVGFLSSEEPKRFVVDP